MATSLAQKLPPRWDELVGVAQGSCLAIEDVLNNAGESVQRRTGTKQLHHPIVGDLTLSYEALELPADCGLRILVYTADPDSPSDDALKLLATWSATTPSAEPRADAAH